MKQETLYSRSKNLTLGARLYGQSLLIYQARKYARGVAEPKPKCILDSLLYVTPYYENQLQHYGVK